MARNASIISYLFFAYDSLIFCKNDEADAKAVSDIFNMYQQALGQKINLEKSEIMLICKVETRLKKVFQDWLPIKETSRTVKYLGLPTHVGRSKRAIFRFIAAGVWKKLKGWKEQCLSFARRGVPIRAVAQDIPTYVMICLLLPETL
jgi:hypothetical protein